MVFDQSNLPQNTSGDVGTSWVLGARVSMYVAFPKMELSSLAPFLLVCGVTTIDCAVSLLSGNQAFLRLTCLYVI